MLQKFDVHTTVQIHNTTTCHTPEARAKQAISMVFADNVNHGIILCIGSSLHVCDPPESKAVLLAGCQNENIFRDGQQTDARLSAIASEKSVHEGLCEQSMGPSRCQCTRTVCKGFVTATEPRRDFTALGDCVYMHRKPKLLLQTDSTAAFAA